MRLPKKGVCVQTPDPEDFDAWALARYRALLQEGRVLQKLLLQKGFISHPAIVSRRDVDK